MDVRSRPCRRWTRNDNGDPNDPNGCALFSLIRSPNEISLNFDAFNNCLTFARSMFTLHFQNEILAGIMQRHESHIDELRQLIEGF